MSDPAPAVSSEFDAGYARAIEDLRWLAAARAEYVGATGLPPAERYHELIHAEQRVYDEVTAAQHVGDILAGDNDGAGWLPSWKWDRWRERTAHGVSTSTNQETPVPSNNRVFSRDVYHLRDDLYASLKFALGPEPSSDTRLTASSILDEMTGFDRSQQCLDSIRTKLGPRVFGHVTMFHMYAGTSLSGVSSQATSVRTLRQNGLTLRDLAWPPSQLKEQFQEHAIADAAVEQRLEEAVATWKAEVRA